MPARPEPGLPHTRHLLPPVKHRSRSRWSGCTAIPDSLPATSSSLHGAAPPGVSSSLAGLPQGRTVLPGGAVSRPAPTGSLRPLPPPVPSLEQAHHNRCPRRAGHRTHTVQEAPGFRETEGGGSAQQHRCTLHSRQAGGGRALRAPSSRMALHLPHAAKSGLDCGPLLAAATVPGLLSHASSTEKSSWQQAASYRQNKGVEGEQQGPGVLTPGWSVPAPHQPTHLQPSMETVPPAPALGSDWPGFLPARGPGTRTQSHWPVPRSLSGALSRDRPAGQAVRP